MYRPYIIKEAEEDGESRGILLGLKPKLDSPFSAQFLIGADERGDFLRFVNRKSYDLGLLIGKTVLLDEDRTRFRASGEVVGLTVQGLGYVYSNALKEE